MKGGKKRFFVSSYSQAKQRRLTICTVKQMPSREGKAFQEPVYHIFLS
jgi:hypothetical protein